MGAIQSSFNQTLSLGAILASQSDYFKDKVAHDRAVQELGKQQEKEKQAYSALNKQFKDIGKQEGDLNRKVMDALGNLEDPSISEGARAIMEGEVEELIKGHEVSTDWVFDQTKAYNRRQADLAYQKFKLDPSKKNYSDYLKVDRQAAEYEGKTKAHESAARTMYDVYREQAADALKDRRKELGDLTTVNGVQYPPEHPLSQAILKHLGKEDLLNAGV